MADLGHCERAETKASDVVLEQLRCVLLATAELRQLSKDARAGRWHLGAAITDLDKAADALRDHLGRVYANEEIS